MAANPVPPLRQLHVETQTTGEEVAVVCHGRINSETVPIFQGEVRKLIAGNKHIVLDLGDVTYLDSAGLGALVGLYASAKRNGATMRLANLTPRIVHLLRITHLASVFEDYGQHE